MWVIHKGYICPASGARHHEIEEPIVVDEVCKLKFQNLIKKRQDDKKCQDDFLKQFAQLKIQSEENKAKFEIELKKQNDELEAFKYSKFAFQVSQLKPHLEINDVYKTGTQIGKITYKVVTHEPLFELLTKLIAKEPAKITAVRIVKYFPILSLLMGFKLCYQRYDKAEKTTDYFKAI